MNFAKQNTMLEHCSDKLNCHVVSKKSMVSGVASIVLFAAFLSGILLLNFGMTSQKAALSLPLVQTTGVERQCNNHANRTGYALGCKIAKE
jgi:hypothetical protein